MSIEKLKEQARRHEQKEEWLKALDQYKKAIDRLAEDDQPDIGLYNRVGDLYVRVGNLDQAVQHYEQAVDLYLEAELPNNAIAVCKKVIRNVPGRYQIYLKMGQIRAQQGFLSDARTNYLTYAERAAQAGEQDDSLQALVEFTETAPDDPDMRVFVGEQLIINGRSDEGVAHMVAGYQRLMVTGATDQAAEIEARIREVDPGADLTVAAAPAGSFGGSGVDSDGDIYAQFGEIDLGGPDDAEAEVETTPRAADEASSAVAIPDFEIAGFTDEAEGDSEESTGEVEVDLPLISFAEDGELDVEGAHEEGAFELPLMEGADAESDRFELPTFDSEETEDQAFDLPLMDLGDDSEDGDEEVVDLPLIDMDVMDDGGPLPVSFEPAGSGTDGADGDSGGEQAADAFAELVEDVASDRGSTVEELRAGIAAAPDDLSLRQRLVEISYVTGDAAVQADAYLGLASVLERAGQAARARAAYQQVLQVDPANGVAQAALSSGGATPPAPVQEVAAQEDYVDLGALILGDVEEKTTRFTVAYEEPSGDEDADFAKMLSQFKDKVSENLDADDVRAHHDLGTAYKEMGLLDEAIAEYQQALRASPSHLPTFELMGQTFMEMGNADQAIRSLERALSVDTVVEDDLVGIYYHLARAYEDTAQTEKAVEFYDRVFSLDINFADVTERLRALR